MKIDRLMSIVFVLLEKKRISAKELADMFEVSLRTIYRDIDAIDLAGVPICSTSGVGGGFEILPSYKIDKNVFSPSDLTAILTGLSSLTNMIKGDELMNALAKIKSFIPPERAKEIELKVNQIYVDLDSWNVNSNIQPYLEDIKTALQSNNLTSFEYIAHHGNITNRIVEPYQLVLKNSHWYLYGYCYQRSDFRMFKLSRMLNLQIKNECFIRRDYQKPQLEFSEVLQTMQTKVKIRIHKCILDRVLDYCSYDNFSPDGDDYFIVNFPFVENDYHYDILLSFADKCECLQPSHIRTKLKSKLYDTLSLYKD